MKNKFMAEVSHCLNGLLQDQKIFYYMKFEERIQKNQVIGDHMVITNNFNVIFFEEKSTKYQKLAISNILGERANQLKTHDILNDSQLSHYYLIKLGTRQKTHYYVTNNMVNIVNTRMHKSYLDYRDFEGKFVEDSKKVSELIESVINRYKIIKQNTEW